MSDTNYSLLFPPHCLQRMRTEDEMKDIFKPNEYSKAWTDEATTFIDAPVLPTSETLTMAMLQKTIRDVESHFSGTKTTKDGKQFYGGYRIVVSETLMSRTQQRFPRSKRSRIRRKWEKRNSNFVTVPDKNVYVMEEIGVMTMHPSVWKKMEVELQRNKIY